MYFYYLSKICKQDMKVKHKRNTSCKMCEYDV